MSSGGASRKRKGDMGEFSIKRRKRDWEEVLREKMRDPSSRMRLIRHTLPGIVVNNNIAFIKAMSENLILDKETFEVGMMAALLSSNNEIAEIMWNNFRKQANSVKEMRKERKELITKLSEFVSSEVIFDRLNRLPEEPLVANGSSYAYSMDDLVDAFLGVTLETFSEQDLERAVMDSANFLINYGYFMKKELLGKNKEGEMEVEIGNLRLG